MDDSQVAAGTPSSQVMPLALHVRRASAPVVGRHVELGAIKQELASARTGRLTALTLEGEPGIGKTRLLVAAAELAATDGFTALAATADEEIRGPFLLARGIFAPSAALGNGSNGAREQFERASTPSPAETTRRSRACRQTRSSFAFSIWPPSPSAPWRREQPVALLIDDLQWADEDSLRMLRYIVRTGADLPIFLGLSTRAGGDGERQRGRDPASPTWSGWAWCVASGWSGSASWRRREFVQQVLGGKVNLASAATMHAQAEGVPSSSRSWPTRTARWG